MSEHIILASDVLLDEMVLIFVVEDDVDFLGARAADVWAEHDVVRRVSMHVSLIQLAVKKFDISASTINVLLMLHCELHNKRLIPERNYQLKIK